jgi:prolyl-tRNA synthetase
MTEQEAVEEADRMLEVYAKFAREHLALPVYHGEKTESERFPGAVQTLCIEAMVQPKGNSGGHISFPWPEFRSDGRYKV